MSRLQQKTKPVRRIERRTDKVSYGGAPKSSIKGRDGRSFTPKKYDGRKKLVCAASLQKQPQKNRDTDKAVYRGALPLKTV